MKLTRKGGLLKIVVNLINEAILKISAIKGMPSTQYCSGYSSFFKFQIAHMCNRICIVLSMLCHSVTNCFERKVTIVIDLFVCNERIPIIREYSMIVKYSIF